MALLEVPASTLSDVELDELQRRRAQLIDVLFDRLSVRDGLAVSWLGFAVDVEEEVPDRDTGELTKMLWRDEAAAEPVCRVDGDPCVSDAAVLDEARRAVVRAVVNNEVHELAEFMLVDGRRVFDPHPSGRTYDDPLVDVTMVENPASSSVSKTPAVDMDGPAAEVAAALLERISARNVRFELVGGTLWCSASYVCSGVMSEVCVPVFFDGDVVEQLTPTAQLSVLTSACFEAAVRATVEAVSQWLCIGDCPLFTTESAGRGARNVLVLSPVVELRASAWVPTT